MYYSYLYNPEKLERCGDYFALEKSNHSVYTLGSNRWMTFTQEVTLNDVGAKNGSIREWVDGVLVRDLEGIVLRNSGDIYINEIKMDSFYGGGDDTWAPKTTQYAYFDNFIVSETNPYVAK